MRHRRYPVAPCAAALALAAALVLAGTAGAGPTPEPPDEIREMIEAMRLPVAPADPPRAPGAGPVIDAGRGPIPVFVPSSYDPEVPTPLLVLLHGYTSSGQSTEAWMRLTPIAEERGLLYLAPDGTTDCFGQRFWNATDACCNFCGSGIDDSGYLRAIVDLMGVEYNVDPRRVYFVGHSNGGFMSYRMACDHADVVAAVATLAGATFLDPNDCAPAAPVDVLQVHGTADGVIGYNGGCIFSSCYPGAVQTVEQWAAYDGCAPIGEEQPELLDIDADIPGAETVVTRYTQDCDPGGSAELWTVNGGPHSPNLTDDFRRGVIDFLLAHPKPAACPEDLDQSGAVDFGDILAVLAAWGPCGEACPEDLDESGTVDFGDVLAVLGAWGPCG